MNVQLGALNTVIPIQYCEIAQEYHQDGTPHIHVFLMFQRPLNVTNQKFFDCLAETPNNSQDSQHHCNIQPVHSPPGTVTYIRKFDQNTLKFGQAPSLIQSLPTSRSQNRIRNRQDSINADVDGEAEEPSKKKKSMGKFEIVARSIKDDESTLDDIDDVFPGFILQNYSKVKQYINLQQNRKLRHVTPNFHGLTYHGAHIPTFLITKWINKNVLSDTPRRFKQKQLFIFGRPDCYKTTLIRLLKEKGGVRVYPFTYDKYYSEYDDQRYDLIVCDEFLGLGEKSQSVFNQFLEGTEILLPNRYEPIPKNANLPVIIISNRSLESCYAGKPTELEQMKVRVKCIEIPNPDFVDNEQIEFND